MPKGTKQGDVIIPEATKKRPVLENNTSMAAMQEFYAATDEWRESKEPIPHYGAFDHVEDGSVVEYELDCDQREDVCIESNCKSISECKWKVFRAVPVKGKEETDLSEINNPLSQEKTIRFMKWLNDNKLFYVDEVRKWLRLLDKEEISFSKFVELFNQKLFEQQETHPRLYTEAEVREREIQAASEAWDAGKNRLWEEHFGRIPCKNPDKEQYFLTKYNHKI